MKIDQLFMWLSTVIQKTVMICSSLNIITIIFLIFLTLISIVNYGFLYYHSLLLIYIFTIYSRLIQ